MLITQLMFLQNRVHIRSRYSFYVSFVAISSAYIYNALLLEALGHVSWQCMLHHFFEQICNKTTKRSQTEKIFLR